MRLVIILLVLSVQLRLVAAAPQNANALTELTRQSFDAPTVELQLKNGAIVRRQDGIGSSLVLPKNASAVFNPNKRLSAARGTITFWLRTDWPATDKQSHVLLTMPWDDGKHGYLALSYGWWEPLGAQKLYFVVANQEFVFCSAPYQFETGAWAMITVRWQAGKKGQCSINVNEDRVAHNQVDFFGKYNNSGPIFLGSDHGSTDQRNRAAGFAIDELVLFDYPLKDRDILTFYRADNSRHLVAHRTEWDWMRDTLAAPRVSTRDDNGHLLESRVAFDEDIGWAQSIGVAKQRLNRAKAAGFNVYVPCVWHGKGTRYPSPITEIDSSIGPSVSATHDPLKFLIDHAHSLGIEVHPWFTVSRREWDRYQDFYQSGTPDQAYDVHNSEFRTFIVSIILDVVDRYDVDGINLDYIRAMGLCTSDACQQNYKKTTGRNLTNDISARHTSNEAYRYLQSWQDGAIADIVSRVAIAAKKMRPNLVISVDGHPRRLNGQRPLEGRAEVTWANNDWVDVIFFMDYRKRFADTEFDAVRADLTEPEKLFPLFGNFDMVDGHAVARSGTFVTRHFQYAQHKWPRSGAGLFIFTQMNDDQLEALRTGAFVEIAHPKWPSTAANHDAVENSTP